MEMNAERHNRIRLLILKVLAPEYPKTVDSVILRRCLSNFGYPMDNDKLCSYLAYLKERGYLLVEEKKAFDIIMVSITATGLDVLDGRIDDRGIGAEE
jgi:hypothetical protein